MYDYLTFRKMITPMVIQILFWVIAVLVVFLGLASMFQGRFLEGLGMIVFGPIFIRIYMEIIIVMFKINEGIQTIVKRDTM